MAKKALIVLADGFEEIEAIAPFDILKRAGVDVTLAGLSSREIKSARGAKFVTEKTLNDTESDFDAVILPGGSGGADNLSRSGRLKTLILSMIKDGKLVAAICASPAAVLGPFGVLKGKKATCYPGMEKEFPGDVRYSDAPVVVDGNVITGMGPAAAVAFGFKLAEMLAGAEKTESVKKAMLF